jgi:P27 family predicted phage terminase small subunit
LSKIAIPKPPAHLKRSRSFWRAVAGEYELEPAHRELLRRCCEAIDRCDAAQAVLDEQGVVTTDKFGQVRPHPAAGIETTNRLQVLRLLQALKLGEGDLPSATQPAQVLARKRWNKA